MPAAVGRTFRRLRSMACACYSSLKSCDLRGGREAILEAGEAAQRLGDSGVITTAKLLQPTHPDAAVGASEGALAAWRISAGMGRIIRGVFRKAGQNDRRPVASMKYLPQI